MGIFFLLPQHAHFAEAALEFVAAVQKKREKKTTILRSHGGNATVAIVRGRGLQVPSMCLLPNPAEGLVRAVADINARRLAAFTAGVI